MFFPGFSGEVKKNKDTEIKQLKQPSSVEESKFNPSKITPLKNWFMANKLFTKTKVFTHLLLDGGKVNIPESEVSKFLKLYTKDVEAGENNFVCELKTEKFKLFSDLDFFEPDIPISEESILDYLSTIQTVIYEFFNKNVDPDDLYLLASTAPSKNKTIEGQVYIKTGIHLIWPNIFVTKRTSLIIRTAIIQALYARHGKRDPYNTWEEVVDLSVYNANGLRMLGSKKMAACKVCRASKDKLCDDPNCYQLYKMRRVFEDRAYSLAWVMTADADHTNCVLNPKKEEYLKSDTLETVRLSSIRLKDGILETRFDIPIWVKIKETEIQRTKKSKKRQFLSKEDTEGIRSLGKHTKIYEDSDIFKKMEKFIKSNLDKELYKGLSFRSLIKTESGVYFATTNCHYCLNTQREHGSNTIWFYISDNGVSQRCFCRCDTTEGRKYGSCKDLKAFLFPLSRPLQKFLYPGKETKKINYNIQDTFDSKIDNLMERLEEELKLDF